MLLSVWKISPLVAQRRTVCRTTAGDRGTRLQMFAGSGRETQSAKKPRLRPEGKTIVLPWTWMDENRNPNPLWTFQGGEVGLSPPSRQQSDRKQTWDVTFWLNSVLLHVLLTCGCGAEEAAALSAGRGRLRDVLRVLPTRHGENRRPTSRGADGASASGTGFGT